MLLNLTKCSSCSGWRKTSKLCSSLLAETKLKHLKKRSQPRAFPVLLGCSQNSTHLLQGHSVYSNSNNPDKEPTSDGPNTKGGQGTHARAKNRGTATCQNPYKCQLKLVFAGGVRNQHGNANRASQDCSCLLCDTSYNVPMCCRS